MGLYAVDCITIRKIKEYYPIFQGEINICTEEQKRQISLKNSGRKQTEEQRRRHSERMKEYWKGREFPEEQRRRQSEKMKAYWNDREASEAHRQTVSRMMKEMRAGNTSAGKEGDGNA